jgi:RimJ/RimL family protein N-acetyltransferase
MMRVVKWETAGREAIGEAVGAFYEGRDFVYQPVYRSQLDWLAHHGAGEGGQLVLDGDRIAAVVFVQRSTRSVIPLVLEADADGVRAVLQAFFGRSRGWVETVFRPSWDLRVGEELLPLYREAGFRPGPPEVLYRLARADYHGGYEVREHLEGSRLDYRMHDREIGPTLETLTPLLQAWSAFYRLEDHTDESCRLFTASLDAQKAAVLWVLIPSRCRREQNDCYLHWKEEVGDGGIFVRSTVTEEPFRGKGIGSSLHRFMLSRFFEGPDAVDASWISTNEENRANIALLESLGYRRRLVCRYHHFVR